MGKRGRKPQFRPVPPSGPGKPYRLYVPGQGVISLETADEKEAWTKAGQYAQNYAAGGMNSPPSVSPDTTGFRPTPSDTVNAAPSIQQPTAKEMLSAWNQAPSIQSEQLPLSLPDSPLPSQSAPESSPIGGSGPALSISDKVNAVMPPEKRQKIASMLAKGVTLMNVAGAAWCVKLLGTIPRIDDEDEAKEVLKIGWELQLEELFINHPPQPWMVILGGTGALMVGMLLNGERMPKKDNRPKPPENPATRLDFEPPDSAAQSG